MSQPPSAGPAAPETATAASPNHQRSLSEQSTSAPSASASVHSSYNGSLRGRRPVVGVTSVTKRRFRTQSSNVARSTRHPTNAPGTVGSGEGCPVAMHTRPTAGSAADKSISHDEADGKKIEDSRESTSSTKRANATHNEADAGAALPKINQATFQSGVTRVDQSRCGSHENDVSERTEAPCYLTASASLAASHSAGNGTLIKKHNPTALNRTAPPTTISAKDLVIHAHASHGPTGSNGTKRSSPTGTTALPLRISDVSFSTNTEDSLVLGSGKYRTSPTPPRELSSLPRKESFTSPSATPPAGPQPPSSSSAAPAKASEPVAPSSLGPLRGSSHVGGGNSNNNSTAKPHKEASLGKLGVATTDASTPSLSRRESAVHAVPSRSPKTLALGENTASVTLPRVASLLPVHRTASQLSSTNSLPVSVATVRSCGESAVLDPGQTPTPVGQSLMSPAPSRSPRPQPTLPTPSPAATSSHHLASAAATTPPSLQSLHIVSAHPTTEKESKAHAPSRHTSKLEKLPATKAASKSFSDATLPVIVSLFTTPISLRNFGATCYLNSVVQCLLQTPGLLRALDRDRQRIISEWEEKKGGKFDATHRRSCAERNAPATSALLDLGTARPKQATPAPQLLLSLKAACGECNDEFAGNGQNDAHEFLITLLGVIDKEVGRSKPGAYQTMKDVEDEGKREAYARWTERLRRENDSTIYDFFGGVTGSTVQCATCSLISYRFEALLDISLPMAYNCGSRAGATGGKSGKARPEEVVAVDLLLHDMFFSDRGELLSGATQVTCDRCKKLRDKTIWSTMEQWPPFLILHLKRFNNAGVKNESAVIFPYTFCPFGRVKYQLYGVCCHRGTASFGHYTSYVYVDGDASVLASVSGRDAAVHDGDGAKVRHGDRAEDADAFRSPPSGSFARSADDVLDFSEENDLPCGKNITPVKPPCGHSSSCNGMGGGATSGKWCFCNDESITTVSASEVVSKTKEAYLLFYRRVA